VRKGLAHLGATASETAASPGEWPRLWTSLVSSIHRLRSLPIAIALLPGILGNTKVSIAMFQAHGR
jgi:hypothetical protein